MAKLRSNHRKKRAGESSGMIARVVVFFFVLGGLYFYLNRSSELQIEAEPVMPDIENLELTGTDSIFFLPTSTTGQVVKHKYFALSYNEDLELSEWVVFELASGRLNKSLPENTSGFRPDPQIKTGSASPGDYSKSGYEMGQMASAAEMAFSPEAVAESFFMGNAAPQAPGFNKGPWNELQGLTLDWAKRFRHLYVVTGPIFDEAEKLRIGNNRVAVPTAFFKILLDIRGPEKKAIAFVLPNKPTTEKAEYFATTIDRVEQLTGIDFFPDLMPRPMEDSLESSFDILKWNPKTH